MPIFNYGERARLAGKAGGKMKARFHFVRAARFAKAPASPAKRGESARRKDVSKDLLPRPLRAGVCERPVVTCPESHRRSNAEPSEHKTGAPTSVGAVNTLYF